MANGDNLSAGELFEYLKNRLNELEATELVGELERTIGRGVVARESPKSAQEFRSMTDKEKLSIALEHIVAAFSVPLMMARCKEILECDDITWSVEPAEQPAASSSLPPGDGPQNEILSALVDIIDKLQLPISEVA